MVTLKQKYFIQIVQGVLKLNAACKSNIGYRILQYIELGEGSEQKMSQTRGRLQKKKTLRTWVFG